MDLTRRSNLKLRNIVFMSVNSNKQRIIEHLKQSKIENKHIFAIKNIE